MSQRFGSFTYAQHGDDLMILNLFDLMGIHKPSYLDIGAHHPVKLSNTKLLYDRGSNGVNVEANPHLINEFNRHRPEDINICCGVGVNSGSAKFYMYDDCSGLNTFSLDETKIMSGVMGVKREIELPVKTLDEIIKEYCDGICPNLLNVDAEGWDYDILSSYDFISSPVIICVETRRDNADKMLQMLYEKGFVYLIRMGENLFFIRKDKYLCIR